MSQAMIRAGVKTKEETKMTRMKSAGNFKIPHYIHYLHSVWSSLAWLMILKRIKLLLTQHSDLLQFMEWLTRKRPWGRLRCAGVVNKQGEESVSFVTSHRAAFNNCLFLHTFSEKQKQVKDGQTWGKCLIVCHPSVTKGSFPNFQTRIRTMAKSLHRRRMRRETSTRSPTLTKNQIFQR